MSMAVAASPNLFHGKKSAEDKIIPRFGLPKKSKFLKEIRISAKHYRLTIGPPKYDC